MPAGVPRMAACQDLQTPTALIFFTSVVCQGWGDTTRDSDGWRSHTPLSIWMDRKEHHWPLEGDTLVITRLGSMTRAGRYRRFLPQ